MKNANETILEANFNLEGSVEMNQSPITKGENCRQYLQIVIFILFIK